MKRYESFPGCRGQKWHTQVWPRYSVFKPFTSPPPLVGLNSANHTCLAVTNTLQESSVVTHKTSIYALCAGVIFTHAAHRQFSFSILLAILLCFVTIILSYPELNAPAQCPLSLSCFPPTFMLSWILYLYILIDFSSMRFLQEGDNLSRSNGAWPLLPWFPNMEHSILESKTITC